MLLRDVGKDLKANFPYTFSPFSLSFGIQLGEFDSLVPSHDFFNGPSIVIVLHRNQMLVHHPLGFLRKGDLASGSSYPGRDPNLF